MAARLWTLVATLLLGGLLGATLVRMAPGFGIDSRELDPRLNAASIESLREDRDLDGGLLDYYFSYLAGLAKGDLGTSLSLGRPVKELLRERFPATLRSVAGGLALAWFAGLLLALIAQSIGRPSVEVVATMLSGLFLCLPSAVLALGFAFLEAPPALAVAAVVYPRIYHYSRNLLSEAADAPHILAARARGLGGMSILIRHIVPVAAVPLVALMGVSLSIAFASAIPIEVMSGAPGVGQLAWEAALGRDLPVLVNLTLLLAAITLVSNFAADLLISFCPWRKA